MVKIACLNITSTNSMIENIEQVERSIQEAVSHGAKWLFTPECVAFMSASRSESQAHFFTQDSHPALHAFKAMAKDYDIWLQIGSLSTVESTGDERAFGRSYLINNKGEIVESYDKIHLYKTTLDNGESYDETATLRHGSHSVIAPTPWGMLGMCVCYDLRFPQLARCLATQGAHILSYPSAFVEYTGKAHWEVLLRARAIENGCYVVASNQTGALNGRTTYGHSMIIDPWGTVLADAGTQPGLIYADIDEARCDHTRAMLPCHKHDRDFT